MMAATVRWSDVVALCRARDSAAHFASLLAIAAGRDFKARACACLACCARCRYPAAGLETLRCPECGSDLRAAGIVTLALAIRFMPGLLSALLGWSGLAAIVSYLVIFASYRANVRYAATAPTYEPDLVLTPASGSCDRIELRRDYASNEGFPLRLVLHTRDTEHTLRLRHTGYGINFSGADAFSTTIDGRLKAQHIEQWYASAGIDPQLPLHRAELEELTLLVNAELSPEGEAWPTFTAFSSKTPPAVALVKVGFAPVYTTAAVCGSIYVVGTIMVVRRRQQLLSFAARMEQAAEASNAPDSTPDHLLRTVPTDHPSPQPTASET